MNKHVKKLLATSIVACLLPIASLAQSEYQIDTKIDALYKIILSQDIVKKSLEDIKKDDERALKETITITEIPAPPFKEEKRAKYAIKRFQELGLNNAYIDTEGNVIATRKGSGNGPVLVVSAHIDSVFPEGTNVTVVQKGDRYYAPGITDNARGVATMFSMLKIMQDNKIKTKGDIIFIADVGEEGEGDLRGVKAFFRDNKNIDGFFAIDGSTLGRIISTAVGSYHYEVTFKGPGGHSYGQFGQVPNPIHALGRALDKISNIQVPKDPKTTFSVGIIEGGTAIGAISQTATMKIDMRSTDAKELLKLEKQILDAIDKSVVEENDRWNIEPKITVEKKKIGDRPAGSVTNDSPILQAALISQREVDVKSTLVSASTDANIPVSLGIPALTVGKGGVCKASHSLDEYYENKDAYKGAQNALLLALGLAGLDGVTEPLLIKRELIKITKALCNSSLHKVFFI
ncbi:MAG: M20/M25/M40 family metallo-hydrolase [Campylobacteraceae bacterium]